LKTYYRHYCARRHRSYKTLAGCLWPSAVWIKGEGSYAVLAHCKRLTVTLHDGADGALAAKRRIDDFGCGGRCVNEHEVIYLAHPMGQF
jgi:hypothetical protein